ncbi:glutathione S-transferase family protein [Brucellaceae bacterium C25G]
MIDLYTWITPNGLKASIALEEFGLSYRAHAIDLTKQQQFSEAYLKINPGAKIPAIVDHNTGLVLAESGAILTYLAEKTGRFLPASGNARYEVLEWVFWQVGGFGPTLGHAHHFLTYHPDLSPPASHLFAVETARLYTKLEQQLQNHRYLAGDYSIADMSVWPWVSRFVRHKISLDDYPAVKRWYMDIAVRDAVQRGYKVPIFAGEVPLAHAI